MDLAGVWLSEYEFESTGRGATFAGRHYVTARRDGDRLLLRSVPASKSKLSIDLEAKGNALLGVWAEETQVDGYYQGITFFGTLTVVTDPDGRRLHGIWTGGARDGLEVNTGPWSLTLVDDSLSAEALERWNREPEETAG
jgi:hypothetical protein